MGETAPSYRGFDAGRTMPDPIPTTTDPATGTTVQPATPPAAGQPTLTAAPAAPAPKTFTQEEVNGIVQERLAKDRANRPAATAPAAQPAPPAPKTEAPAATPAASGSLSPTDVQQMIVRHGQFVRAVTSAGLNEGQQRLMERAMQADNPQDVSTWCKEYIETMGLGKPTEPTVITTTLPNPAPTEAPKVPPAVAPTAPSTSTLPTSAGLVDYFSLSIEQINQLGPAGLRDLHERARNIGQQMNGAPPRPKAPAQR